MTRQTPLDKPNEGRLYSSPMHIGLDARLTYYRVGGISTYIRESVKALEALDQENRYTIFHSRKARETVTTRFQRANLWTPSHHRLERLAWSVELTRFRLDVLHSTDYIPPFWGARRHVITIHDLSFLLYPQYITADTKRYYSDQIRAAAAQADHILTISEASKADIVRLLGVAPEKITVQACGVDGTYRPLPADQVEAVRRAHDLPSEYFLHVGTIEPRKNIIGLVTAYRELINRMPDLPPIVLVGKPGWHFDTIMNEVREIGVDKHLIWRENISRGDLPAVYNGALAVVMPSHYEGFGLPPLEGMACGVVPVVSNRSSLPEVVGDVGLLVDPDQPSMIAAALEKVLGDSKWRSEMRQRGLLRAAQFTWERTARIALSVYHRVVS